MSERLENARRQLREVLDNARRYPEDPNIDVRLDAAARDVFNFGVYEGEEHFRLTLRDQFAMSALGLYVGEGLSAFDPEDARNAYAAADMLLEARKVKVNP